MAALLSYNLDLKIEDYAGDTAHRVAEIYNHQNCIETIRDFIAKQEEARSPKSPTSPRKSPKSPSRNRSPRDKSPKQSIGVKTVSRAREGSRSTSPRDKSPKLSSSVKRRKDISTSRNKDKKMPAKSKNIKRMNH